MRFVPVKSSGVACSNSGIWKKLVRQEECILIMDLETLVQVLVC